MATNYGLRITPQNLMGHGYAAFIPDTWQLPEMKAHKKREDAAWDKYMKANDYRSNYLGGRTSGTQAEYAEWKRRAALSDAASAQWNQTMMESHTALNTALNNWGRQHGVQYNPNNRDSWWSWIGGKDPLAMADPLPKDDPYAPVPVPKEQKPSSPYESGKSPFKLAGGNVPYISDDSDRPYNFEGSGNWEDPNDLQEEIDSLLGPGGGFEKVQNNNDMQIASLDNLGGYGAAAGAAYLTIQGIQAGKKAIENFSNKLRKQRTNQNEQSRTGGSQSREQAATTAAGSQRTKDKNRYSNLKIRTAGSGGNNTAQLNTGILV